MHGANCIQGRKLILRDPKSGWECEYVFIHQKTTERLKEYAKSVCENPEARVFRISYEAARVLVAKAGRLVGIKLKPHDLFFSHLGELLHVQVSSGSPPCAGDMAQASRDQH